MNLGNKNFFITKTKSLAHMQIALPEYLRIKAIKNPGDFNGRMIFTKNHKDPLNIIWGYILEAYALDDKMYAYVRRYVYDKSQNIGTYIAYHKDGTEIQNMYIKHLFAF
jgi:hypothetical protein